MSTNLHIVVESVVNPWRLPIRSSCNLATSVTSNKTHLACGNWLDVQITQYWSSVMRRSWCFHLTHWGRDKKAAVSQTTLSNAFSWMKMLEFRLRFHWSLFLRVQLTIFQHWFRWLGAGQATSHYLNQWWLVYYIYIVTHICVTRPQWVKKDCATIFVVEVMCHTYDVIIDITNIALHIHV